MRMLLLPKSFVCNDRSELPQSRLDLCRAGWPVRLDRVPVQLFSSSEYSYIVFDISGKSSLETSIISTLVGGYSVLRPKPACSSALSPPSDWLVIGISIYSGSSIELVVVSLSARYLLSITVFEVVVGPNGSSFGGSGVPIIRAYSVFS